MMKKIQLNDTDYYNTIDIKKIKPKIFYKCLTIRAIISIQDLKKNDYCFAYIKKKKWILSDSSYPRARLLLTVDCYEQLLNNLEDTKKNVIIKQDTNDDELSDNESSDNESSDDDDIKMILRWHQKY